MIVTKRETKEIMMMSSATFVVSSTNLMMSGAYIVGDLVGEAVDCAFHDAKRLGEKMAEKHIKKYKINSEWDD